MRLPVSVDVIAIALCIAVILVSADDAADHAAECGPCDCASTGTNAGKNGASESAGAGTNRCSGCGACDLMVLCRCGSASGKRQTSRSRGRNEQTLHLILQCWTSVSVRRVEVRSGHSHEPWRKRNGPRHKNDEAEADSASSICSTTLAKHLS